jgi:hypothetical protein
VQVWTGGKSELTIKGWDRPTVQVDSDDETLQVTRRQIPLGTTQSPLSVTIPLANVRYRDAAGVPTETTLAPEDFPFPGDVRAGLHDNVRVVSAEGSHVTVMVPNTAAVLDARVRGAGLMSIADYRGSALFATMGAGRMIVTNVTTSAFLQPLYAQLLVSDSSFDRLRVRASTAALIFQRVRSRQIEASTLSGPIVYDNGSFVPGLARFESQNGSIAIGAANGAQIAARSGDGRVFGLWEKKTPVDVRGENDATATINGGGAAVNAVTGHGNVYLYEGALASKRAILPAANGWRVVDAVVRRSQAAAALEPASENGLPAQRLRPPPQQRFTREPRPR